MATEWPDRHERFYRPSCVNKMPMLLNRICRSRVNASAAHWGVVTL